MITKQKEAKKNSKVGQGLVNVGPAVMDLIIKEAVEDGRTLVKIYNLSSYTRLILSEFVRARQFCRDHNLHIPTPEEMANIIINQQNQCG
jgi:hypothetical protein